MHTWIKNALKHTPFYHILRNWAIKRRQAGELAAWEKAGKPVPPPHIVKQEAIRSYAKKTGVKVLVETGTCLGDMVEAMKHDFEKIYTIELSQELHALATRRFKRDKNIELIRGDSGVELKNIMARLQQPALFWLDGHYSGEVTAKGDKNTPIYEELTHIWNAPDFGHVILIDDARCFGREAGYPSLEELFEFIRSKKSNVDIAVQNDSIRITPKS